MPSCSIDLLPHLASRQWFRIWPFSYAWTIQNHTIQRQEWCWNWSSQALTRKRIIEDSFHFEHVFTQNGRRATKVNSIVICILLSSELFQNPYWRPVLFPALACGLLSLENSLVFCSSIWWNAPIQWRCFQVVGDWLYKFVRSVILNSGAS